MAMRAPQNFIFVQGRFLLSLSTPGAWRAVAGPVAEETTPVNVTGGSPLRRLSAVGMLIGLAVNAGNLVEGYGLSRLRIQDSAGVRQA